jgi:hypothetical protein
VDLENNLSNVTSINNSQTSLGSDSTVIQSNVNTQVSNLNNENRITLDGKNYLILDKVKIKSKFEDINSRINSIIEKQQSINNRIKIINTDTDIQLATEFKNDLRDLKVFISDKPNYAHISYVNKGVDPINEVIDLQNKKLLEEILNLYTDEGMELKSNSENISPEVSRLIFEDYFDKIRSWVTQVNEKSSFSNLENISPISKFSNDSLIIPSQSISNTVSPTSPNAPSEVIGSPKELVQDIVESIM